MALYEGFAEIRPVKAGGRALSQSWFLLLPLLTFSDFFLDLSH